MKKLVAIVLTLLLAFSLLLTGCSNQGAGNMSAEPSAATSPESSAAASPSAEPQPKTVTDIYGRQVELPAKIERIAAIGGAARFITYAGCAEKLVGVTDMDKKGDAMMPYSYVNKDNFAKLSSVGAGGASDTTYTEELVTLAPDVIFCLKDQDTAEDVQSKTGIPVVAIYPDGVFSDSVYESIEIIGEVMGTQDHCAMVVQFMKDCQTDLENRTKDIPDSSKPTVYAGAVSFKGGHGFEGTYGQYPPFMAINAINVVDETGQVGGIIIDKEKVVAWDPDIIFLNPANMSMVNDDYKVNPDFYDNLTAVKEGKVYSQISYNYNWTNIEIAIADTYYAGTIIYPDAFEDVDPVAKADEIFKIMLGQTYYQQLVDAGAEFGPMTIGK
jgi:iron complex transport system substrate-binding protein